MLPSSQDELLDYLTLEERKELETLALGMSDSGSLTSYQGNATGYATDILGVNWWEKQREVAEKLVTPPYKVLVKACHDVGKTHLMGGLVNWWFDSYPKSITLTTAPTDRQVK